MFTAGKARVISLCGLISLMLIICYIFPVQGYAELEWSERKQLKLDDAPLDVVQSDDGQWIFILSRGKVLVYTSPEDKVSQIIPVAEGYDSLSYSDPNKRLVLSNSSQNLVKIIQLEVVHKIEVSGLPFRGAQNAPVTIAVFSDYQ
jgi:hypothetical protein